MAAKILIIGLFSTFNTLNCHQQMEPQKIRCFYSKDEINFNKNRQSRSADNQTEFNKRDLSFTLGADDIEVSLTSVL